jgi:hypothetical protein
MSERLKSQKMPVYQNTLLVVFISAAMLIVTGSAFSGQAGIQVVKLNPSELVLAKGDISELSLEYNVLNGEAKTTGLGLRIHFNSSVLTHLALQNVFTDGLVAQDKIARNDTDDLDNDPLTDKYLSVAWLGISADWPKSEQFPIRLGKIVFQINQNSKISSTTLNINSSSTPAGYRLYSEGVSISIK